MGYNYTMIIKNILPTNELLGLKTVIESEKKRRTVNNIQNINGVLMEFENDSFIGIDPGREMLELFPMPNSVIKSFKMILDNDFFEYFYIGSAYCKYSNRDGNPNLPMHKDKNPDNVCFDYQLDSNTDWPLIIEDVEYLLENNSGLYMEPGIQTHGRPEKIFSDEEYIELLFTFWRKNARV